jgi:hypothetical protein
MKLQQQRAAELGVTVLAAIRSCSATSPLVNRVTA